MQTAYDYSINRINFNERSILDITINFGKQKNIKELGPIPFFINELEFLDKFKDDEDAINPKVNIRPLTISEVFDPQKPIDIFILLYDDIESELKKQ